MLSKKERNCSRSSFNPVHFILFILLSLFSFSRRQKNAPPHDLGRSEHSAVPPYYTAQKGNVTLRPVTGPAVSAFHAAAPRWLVSVLWESLQPKAFLSKGKTGGHWSFQRIVTNIIINTADEKCQWENCENRRKGGFPKTRTALAAGKRNTGF